MVSLIWIGFIVLILGLLALDLGVFHRRMRAVSMGEALAWVGVWISVALLFNVLVYFLYEYHWLGIGLDVGHQLPGSEAATLFFSGYLTEVSLSADNVFVIALIIRYFAVPAVYQHRLLFWGILGAMVMRGVMIGLGAKLIEEFDWIIYIFGALLIFTAVKMLLADAEHIEPERNPWVRLARHIYPVTATFEGPKFFVQQSERWAATPLFLALLVIESTDLLFAIDSIPAIFGLTHDPFLVFTSNVFAILGLRSMYFALAGLMDKFKYLKVSLVFLLAFVGTKMLAHKFFDIPPKASLLVIVGILSVGVLASILAARRETARATAGE